LFAPVATPSSFCLSAADISPAVVVEAIFPPGFSFHAFRSASVMKRCVSSWAIIVAGWLAGCW
jgi:hypothetical protein